MAINLEPRSKYDEWTGSFLREENVRHGEHEQAHVDPADEPDAKPEKASGVQIAPRRQTKVEDVAGRRALRAEAPLGRKRHAHEPDDAGEFLQGKCFNKERHVAITFRKS